MVTQICILITCLFDSVLFMVRRIDLFTSQGLLDEMEKNDQLIGEVYNKGDALLQVISGKSKASVESELNQLEEDWAEFCQDAPSVKSVIEETIQMWIEFEENRDKLAEWLGELERAHTGVFIGPANLEALKDELENNKVGKSLEQGGVSRALIGCFSVHTSLAASVPGYRVFIRVT